MPTVLITGASRGLGLEFVRQYAADGWRVLACARRPEKATELNAIANDSSAVRVCALDVTDFAAIDQLSAELNEEKIDVLINNAGVFGPMTNESTMPLQDFEHIDFEAWQSVLLTNTLAPLKMVGAFMPQIVAGSQKKIITISSSMGSIADAYGGYYLYGSSKAAVNRAMVSLAKDLKDKGISVALFCPGWVKTDMGGAMAEITPEQSISGLRERIKDLTLAKTGEYRNYNGDAMSW